MRTFLFYDLETSGLHHAFDQVLQFGAIRTNEQLEEIERHEFRIKIRPDVIPSPEALTTTKVNPELLHQGTYNEYEAIKVIHALFNTPETTSIGYNSIGFDDLMLRHAFYRNLFDPYTHGYSNKCSRADLLPVAIIYRQFAPEGIQWPVTEEGKPSMKLELISKLNALASGNAHDAMVDVEATLALARKMKQNATIWSWAMGYFDKNNYNSRLEKYLEAKKLGEQLTIQWGLLVDNKLGGLNGYQAPVLYLGFTGMKQHLYLQLDRTDLEAADQEGTLNELNCVWRGKAGEPPFILPFDKLQSEYITEERRALMSKNIQWIKNNPQSFEQLRQFQIDFRYAEVQNVDEDDRIYQGFWESKVKNMNLSFHQAKDWNEKYDIAGLYPNETVRTLARRILFRNEERLSPELGAQQMEFITERWADEDIIDKTGRPRLTAQKALERTEELLQEENLADDNRQILEEYMEWLHERLANFY